MHGSTRPRRRVTAVVSAAVLLATLTLVARPAAGVVGPPAIIDNGTIQLGVNPEGHLNVGGGTPSSGGTTDVGLRFMATNAESTAPGCLCEGWGAADATTSTSGWASVDNGGVSSNLTVESFTSTASTAVSVVTIGSTLRVTHDYHPSGATANLYEVTVTLENISGSTVSPRYRRVMDWDVEPSAFSEYSTIGGTAAAANVLFASDDGFADSDPLAGNSDINFTGDAVDNGPADHGALFDFGFAPLAAGASMTFNTYYGAAADEDSADAALGAVGAEVYSYGQASEFFDGTNTVALDPAVGEPNTFIFAFAGVGGRPVVPAVRFTSATYSAGEASGTATIGVELSAAAGAAVTVQYATADGTAAAGADYTASSGTVTIPAGSTTGSFAVPILDDALVEGNETVNLSLSSPTVAVLGSPAAAVLTIVDDDSVASEPHATSTASTGPASGQYSDPATLSGRLVDTTADPDAGIAGKSLGFQLGTQSASAGPTDANGDVSTSLTVVQQPATVPLTTTFAGDPGYAASSDSDTFTITKEDCTVAYTGSQNVTGGSAAVLSAQFGEPDASPGAWSGKTVAFTVTDGSLTSTTYTAVTDAAGTASTSQLLAAGSYGVVASFAGDDFYLPCAAAEQLLVVVAGAPASKVTGGGFVVADGRTSFGFNAQTDGAAHAGQLQVRAPGRNTFHGSTVTDLVVAGTSATWSGDGRWNGEEGYVFTVSVGDNRDGGGRKPSGPDTFSVVIRTASGTTVFTAGGPLKGGNVTVH